MAFCGTREGAGGSCLTCVKDSGLTRIGWLLLLGVGKDQVEERQMAEGLGCVDLIQQETRGKQ